MAKLNKDFVSSITAPDLLNLIRDTGKSSFLRQRVPNKVRREEKWKYCFSVLVHTALYIYDDETSKRPRDCINLIGYDCVKRIESEKCLFGFSLVCTSKSKMEAQFASFSDTDRRQWMRKVKEHLCKANNVPLKTFLFDSTIEDEGEYVAIEEPIQLKDDTSSDRISDVLTSKPSRRNAVTDYNFLNER